MMLNIVRQRWIDKNGVLVAEGLYDLSDPLTPDHLRTLRQLAASVGRHEVLDGADNATMERIFRENGLLP